MRLSLALPALALLAFPAGSSRLPEHLPLQGTGQVLLHHQAVGAAPDDGVAFYHRAGWSDAAIENYRARFGNFGKRIHAMLDFGLRRVM